MGTLDADVFPQLFSVLASYFLMCHTVWIKHSPLDAYFIIPNTFITARFLFAFLPKTKVLYNVYYFRLSKWKKK